MRVSFDCFIAPFLLLITRNLRIEHFSLTFLQWLGFSLGFCLLGFMMISDGEIVVFGVVLKKKIFVGGASKKCLNGISFH